MSTNFQIRRDENLTSAVVSDLFQMPVSANVSAKNPQPPGQLAYDALLDKMFLSTGTSWDELCSSDLLNADYVICGGGTSGCILAGRLAQKYKVILLEAGTNQDSNPIVTVPSNNGDIVSKYINKFLQPLAHAETFASANSTKRFPAIAGGVLGGGSTVNGMQYVRSTPSVFNTWQVKAGGDPSWGATNAYQVYKDMEKYSGILSSNHGTTGPVDIRQATKFATASATFAAAGAAYYGVPVVSDYNAETGADLCADAKWQLFETPTLPIQRVSASSAYVEPNIANPNLRIIYNTLVNRVLFDSNKKATGVEVSVDGHSLFLSANKKIIISCGFQSSLVLERSGIGSATVLDAAGITRVHVNENVGNHTLNHPIISLTGTAPANSIIPGTVDLQGLYTGVVFAPDTTQSPTLRAFEMIGILTPSPDSIKPDAFTIASLLLRAKSEGTIHIPADGGKNPSHLPIFDFNYFGNLADVTSAGKMVNGMYNILFTNMGLTVSTPGYNLNNLPDCQAYALANFGQAYHYISACRMGTALDGVVDNNCDVIGVTGLAVCDTSIIPINCDGNTAAPAFLVGNVLANKILGL